jgi:hypothetical protein
MTTIKVTPEQLLLVSRQFEAAQSQVFQMKRLKAEGPLNYIILMMQRMHEILLWTKHKPA